GYDPYTQHRNPTTSRDDPYGYGRPPTRDPYLGREDPYSSRPTDRQRHRTHHPVENGHAPLSRLAGPTEDPYSRHQKVEDPYAHRKVEDPYSHRKVEDPYSHRKVEDPYSHRKVEDPYSHRRVEDPYSHRRVEDPYSHRRVDDPYSHRKVEDPYLQRKPEDPYSTRKPEDPYRHERQVEDEPYARVNKDRHRNGAGLVEARDDYRSRVHESDGATSSFPNYEMDHLATFKVETRQGVMSPMDGIRKLRHMEVSTGIWTMRITLVIEPQDLIVIDRASGEDMERFPVSAISQPTAVTNDDRRDVYNNIVLFTIIEESRKGPQSEMHLFQCIGRPAHEVVDDIKAAKAGKIRGPIPRRNQDYPGISDKMRDFEQHAQHNYIATQGYHQDVPSTQLLRQSMHHDDNESILSDHTDQEVLEMNKNEVDVKEETQKSDDYDVSKLSMEECQAKLKPHIHDPNAPELVHFLFTPLSLVVEASKDPRHGTPDIAARVLSPMLTVEAKELLLNCLSSKETSLWNSLGDAWTLSREEYRGHVPSYNPRFSDGWEPPRSWTMDGSHIESVPYHESEVSDFICDSSPPPMDAHAKALAEFEQEYRRREERRHEAERQREEEQFQDERWQEPESERDFRAQSSAPKKSTFEEEQEDFVQQLQEKNAKVAEAIHPRQGKNTKEVTLQKGEYVEVIDSSRKWWKVRNYKGEVGHAPFTILRELPANAVRQ
ncbi:hypothetical protein LSH36_193g15031, partial [Paralvinella palmiformis]